MVNLHLLYGNFAPTVGTASGCFVVDSLAFLFAQSAAIHISPSGGRRSGGEGRGIQWVTSYDIHSPSLPLASTSIE